MAGISKYDTESKQDCAYVSTHFHGCAGQKKWLAVEEQKPKKERRPLPPPPASIAAGELPTGKAADDFNEEMYQHWDQKSLVGCPFCKKYCYRWITVALAQRAQHFREAGLRPKVSKISNRQLPYGL
eukprot:1158828-Pelagomonas_calceolata.AAC.6